MIQDLIDQVPPEATRYFNCPYCGSVNKTLGITKESGRVKWGCFRVSCKTRGAKGDNITPEQVKNRLTPKKDTIWAKPDYFIDGISNEKVYSLLSKYHCLEAYSKRYFRCAYDPKEDRLVFYLIHKEWVLGAVGRAISPVKGSPKVMNYHAPLPFITQNKSDKLLIVEDCFSAIRATDLGYVGSALLGTNLKREYIPYFAEYSDVTLALDADARSKAFKMMLELRNYIPSIKLIFLQKDLKDYVDISDFESYVVSNSNGLMR